MHALSDSGSGIVELRKLKSFLSKIKTMHEFSVIAAPELRELVACRAWGLVGEFE